MKYLERTLIIILAAFMVFFTYTLAQAEGKYNLKPGARGKLCLTCHKAFGEKMKAKHIHTPLKEGDCSGCHNPHASNHGVLLEDDANAICYTCHENKAPENAVSVHQIVAEGNCVACHDPHASPYRGNLLKGGSELCFGCHDELGKKIASNKFDHAPVKQDCLKCHNPHASKKNVSLLKVAEPKLCLNCHKTTSSGFKSRHMNYPVEKGTCTSCHDPHGSNAGAILADNVHPPMQEGMCDQCHNAANSADPFAVKKEGAALCQGCHYDTINETMNKKRIHWPLLDKKGCINCHSPHASAESGLMKKSMLNVCGQCHADTIKRQERAITKHEPISDGECTVCHSPHSSDKLFLMSEATTVDVCGQCHDWQTHSTHPIGAEIVDPRNRNLTLDCLSCHRSHGTEYKHFIYTSEIQALCVQCHTKYRR